VLKPVAVLARQRPVPASVQALVAEQQQAAAQQMPAHLGEASLR
jgi:hypothetical protein